MSHTKNYAVLSWKKIFRPEIHELNHFYEEAQGVIYEYLAKTKNPFRKYFYHESEAQIG